jgi:CubicO group peptidase (beta-lactamase class C family)
VTARPPIRAEHWHERLGSLAAEHQVPGAALGILRLHPDGEGEPVEQVELATGVLNLGTGAAATPDSLFQIGSITKVWTATMVMQLVEEGTLDLDAPILEVLPELRLSGPEVTEQVTMRHLLTHTSGIDGDVFSDTGRGDDSVERYVELLAKAAQNQPLGATHSYCNAGYVIAGRVVEKLTGLIWDEALRARLGLPLGLTRTFTLAEEAIVHRVAVGHLGAEPTPTQTWAPPRSVGPAGSIISTVGEVLAFARMHLRDGVADDGGRVLGAASVAEMTRLQAEVPDTRTLGDSWGLGWIRFGWDGRRLFGHDGATIGQAASLRILPDEGLAVVVLANGGRTHNLFHDLFHEVFSELAGLSVPRPCVPPPTPPVVDLGRHLGVYERSGVRIEVFLRDGVPILRHLATGELAFMNPDPEEHELVAADASGSLFLVRREQERRWLPVTFYRLPTGEQYLHLAARATPKVG